MTGTTSSAVQRDVSTSRALCPSWCVVAHGSHLGEEDWLHTSEPIALTTGVRALLVMSTDPASDTADGPFITVGEIELIPDEAAAAATRLLALAALAAGH